MLKDQTLDNSENLENLKFKLRWQGVFFYIRYDTCLELLCGLFPILGIHSYIEGTKDWKDWRFQMPHVPSKVPQ